MKEESIDNAVRFLDACRRSARKLDALNARIESMGENGYLKTVARLGELRGISGEAAVSNDRLLNQAKEKAGKYAVLCGAAREALSKMEDEGACSDGDAALLDYFYLQGKSLRECARLLSYSESYIREKKIIAIAHFAPYAPRLW